MSRETFAALLETLYHRSKQESRAGFPHVLARLEEAGAMRARPDEIRYYFAREKKAPGRSDAQRHRVQCGTGGRTAV